MSLQTKATLAEKVKNSSEAENLSKTVILDDSEFAEIFNNTFVNLSPSLKILPKENYEVELGNKCEQVLSYIHKFKTTQENDISTKRVKEFSEVFTQYFYENIKSCIGSSVFSANLKIIDLTPAFEKK